MPTTVEDTGIAELFRQLTEATLTCIAAEEAHIVALSPDGALTVEAVNLANALLGHARALLAVQLANGSTPPGVTTRIVSIEARSGDEWIPLVGGGACEARPGETATDQALRHADENDLLASAHTWRVLVWTDPLPGAEPDGEWTNLTALLPVVA